MWGFTTEQTLGMRLLVGAVVGAFLLGVLPPVFRWISEKSIPNEEINIQSNFRLSVDFPKIDSFGEVGTPINMVFINNQSADIVVEDVFLQQTLITDRAYKGEKDYLKTFLEGDDQIDTSFMSSVTDDVQYNFQSGHKAFLLRPKEFKLDGQIQADASFTVSASKSARIGAIFETKQIGISPNITLLCPIVRFVDREGVNRAVVCAGINIVRVFDGEKPNGTIFGPRGGYYTLLPIQTDKRCKFLR